jgi:ribosome biogenesis GTPase
MVTSLILPSKFPTATSTAGCKHYKEPGCAVREAVLAGQIDKRRYKHYLIMRKELEEQLVATYD